MAESDLAIIAEGELPSGEHWVLRAGGTSTEFGTFLETIHPDGRRDQGGMGGPPLWPGSIMNVYTGGTDAGPRRFVVRADERVARVRVQLVSGETLDLSPVATMPNPGLAFFATLLARTAALATVTAIDASGEALEPQDLARHERAWRRFRER
ncbi:MAG TPA: hypothetical protein VMA32_12415 [Streptosporangiaceae bacterium]|nr:hypothetical protein [Streptosporangiaceae bacterium]